MNSAGRLGASVAVALALVAAPSESRGQNTNIFLPVDSIEFLLGEAPFVLPDSLPGTRSADDRTQLAVLGFADGSEILAKWALAPLGGDAFNDSPRYEFAAYEIQKLFLDEPEYVVPPTVLRVLPLDSLTGLYDEVEATFDDARSVLVVLQYFVYGLTADGVFDRERLAADPVYARHWANANLLTYLIRHSDSNRGNLLISTRASNPRVFSVDNGVAFGSEESTRGTRWRDLLVDRFPGDAVTRLRAVTEEELHRALGVLAEWRIEGGQLVRVLPLGDNLWPQRGVREMNGVVQIGLTESEIDALWDRLEAFLYVVDGGSFSTY